MWNQTLKKIDHTTTPVAAAALWGCDAHSVKLINDGINIVYRFEINGQGKYLRITHERIRPEQDIEAAIDYQLHLYKHNAPICLPIRSKSGKYLEEVTQDELTFLVHVTNEVPGQVIDLNRSDAFFYESWGKSLARLHLAAKSYQPAEKHKFMAWDKLWSETAEYLKNDEATLHDAFQDIDRWFKQLDITPDNFGLSHGDHRLGNVLYDGHEINIIDFDEPVYHWYIADIARPFLELPNTPFSEWRNKFECFIAGYRSIYPVSDDLLSNIHWFARMKSLNIYLWCKNNWFEPTAPGGKPRDLWLEELRKMVFKPVFSY